MVLWVEAIVLWPHGNELSVYWDIFNMSFIVFFFLSLLHGETFSFQSGDFAYVSVYEHLNGSSEVMEYTKGKD